MARVVQRRGGPPYLLIVFIFLTVVAATLAVIFYTQLDKAQAEKAQELAARKVADGKVGDLKGKVVPKLVKAITGTSGKADAAVKETTAVLRLDGSKEYNSLAQAVRGMDTALTAKSAEIKRLADRENELTGTVATLTTGNEKIQATFDQKFKDLQDERDADRGDFTKKLGDKDAQIKRGEEAKDKIIDQKDLRIADIGQELESERLDSQQQKARISELEILIKDLRGEGAELPRKPDGKILQVLLDQNLCYVNLGQKDQVKPGLTFSVYSATEGIPEDGKGKAKLQVINVGPATSICRIVQAEPGDTITDGDLVFNLIFSPTRTYRFVVEGEFDLYGTGRHDPTAAAQIRKLIDSFGGEISENVQVNTDYVVLGVRPPMPPTPGEDATPQARALHNEKMKVFNRWKAVSDTAKALSIPSLNTNRFLNFSGYVPKKRLED